MPDNQIFDTSEEQKKLLKKYIDKLKNPDQITQGLMGESDMGSSIMDSPSQRAMYNASHNSNMSPENMVTSMGMPAMGMVKTGNVLNIMEELAAKKAAPVAAMEGEAQIINAKPQFAEKAFNDREAADLAIRNGPSDPIESIRARFGDNIPKHIDKSLGMPHDEPYSHGDIHDLIYSAGNRDNPGAPMEQRTIGANRDALWNSPFPIPRKFDPEKSGGILGKGVPDGSGPDPFMWMDNKYGAGKQALADSKGQPLEIHTRSDLIGADDYIQNIDKDNHTIFMHIPSMNEDMVKHLEPGAPSLLRRLKAAERLREAGVDVRLVQDQLIPPKMDSTQSQAFQQMLGGAMDKQDPRIWGTINKFGVQPNEIQLGPQQMQNINKALGTDFKPLVKKKK